MIEYLSKDLTHLNFLGFLTDEHFDKIAANTNHPLNNYLTKK